MLMLMLHSTSDCWEPTFAPIQSVGRPVLASSPAFFQPCYRSRRMAAGQSPGCGMPQISALLGAVREIPRTAELSRSGSQAWVSSSSQRRSEQATWTFRGHAFEKTLQLRPFPTRSACRESRRRCLVVSHSRSLTFTFQEWSCVPSSCAHATAAFYLSSPLDNPDRHTRPPSLIAAAAALSATPLSSDLVPQPSTPNTQPRSFILESIQAQYI